MLQISEIFVGIEGEGIDQGCLTHFVRLAGCSLRCSWCDTKYAWAEGDAYAPDRLFTELRTLAPASRLSITGGEPFEQITGLRSLFEDEWVVLNQYAKVNIETSGAIVNQDVLALTRDLGLNCMLTVSPKMPSAKARVEFSLVDLAEMIISVLNVDGPPGASVQLKLNVAGWPESCEEDWEAAKALLLGVDAALQDASINWKFLRIPAVVIPVMNLVADKYTLDRRDVDVFIATIQLITQDLSRVYLRFGIQLQKFLYGCKTRGV